MSGSPELVHLEARASKHTFEAEPVRIYVEERLGGKVLNLFAGPTELRHNGRIVRNDINEEIDAEYHFDAVEVGEYFAAGEFETVILDPPFSFRKSHDYYDGRCIENLTKVKDEVQHLVEPGGRVLTFGYHTRSLGKSRGFKREEIVLIAHYGGVRATLGVCERRVEKQLSDFECS